MSNAIFQINFSAQSKLLARPKYRLPKFLAFLNALIAPLEWLRRFRLYFYKFGVDSSVQIYNPEVATYNRYDTAIWTDGAVYSYIAQYPDVYPDGAKTKQAPSTPIHPISPSDSSQWIKVLDSFIGVDERMGYNCSTLSLEYMLNKWFGTLYPSFYPEGAFWPSKYATPQRYPDPYNEDANKPVIYISILQSDTHLFVVGESDYTDSSSVGLDDSTWGVEDYIGPDDGVIGNSVQFVVNYPRAMIDIEADGETYKKLVERHGAPAIQAVPRFTQLNQLVNTHKHFGIIHGYKSY